MHKHQRLVGILGGMGPAATADLLKKIVALSPARCDQEHVPLVIWNVPQIPSRSEALLDTAAPSPQASLRKASQVLAQAGAQAIAIACNTAHHWASDVGEASGLPLLHIADAALTALESKASGCKTPARVMLLATEGTLLSGFYQARASRTGIFLETPDKRDQSLVNDAISSVKAGHMARARSTLHPLIEHHLKQGISVFMLACTELPLILESSSLMTYCIDSTHALAQAIVDFAACPTLLPLEATFNRPQHAIDSASFSGVLP